jgi:transcriptional regulator with XRE-family HTH domain
MTKNLVPPVKSGPGEKLGELVGVKKAQISKLENSLTDARFETIIKVFKALNAKINFNVEMLHQKSIKVAQGRF